MRIGVAGKGGSGKTTISGTLSRALVEDGRPLVAIDADPNPNLGPTLGVDKKAFDAGRALPSTVLDHRTVDGEHQVFLAQPFQEVLDQFAIDAPGNIHLLTMGRPEQAGGG
ncbi:MAG: AAA family ATPase [Acidimicrobiia bacterium]|nr:AAA family ATPase [Acidimicrobiia bacterium]